jgi:hypothetical protein
MTRPERRPPRMSAICGAAYDAQDRPAPGTWHPGCTGGVCGCPCHHVTPPTGLRAVFEAARTEARTQSPASGQDREAGPDAGTTTTEGGHGTR